MVARKDKDVFRIIALDKIDVLINCVGRSLIPICAACVLIRGKDVNAARLTVEIPVLSASNVVGKFKRLILKLNNSLQDIYV